MACHSCGADLPEAARFCPSCGTPVRRAAAERRERRFVTVLFADLAGFTASSDGADVEDVHAHVRPWLRIARTAIEAEGGEVVRVLGDGVMAMWGYRAAREDDATRAARAGARMLERLRAELPGRHARVGINSGEALLTYDGAFEDADDAMGDAVNVAARLQGVAALDEVLVGEATAALAGPSIGLEPAGPFTLKGKPRPVPAWRVTGVREASTGGGVTAAGEPLAGRHEELDVLLAAAAEAAGRPPSVVRRLVLGEPGIGKSRLVAEVADRLATGGIRAWVARCRPGGGSPLQAWAGMVAAWAGIGPTDGEAAVVDRLDRALPAGEPDREWLARVLRQLVLGARGPVEEESSSPEERHRALARATALLTEGRPTLVIVEDVHWADDDLVAFLEGDALRALAAPVCLLVTGRPETVARHAALAAPEETVRLGPLPSGADDQLAGALAARFDLDPGERAIVQERSGGNPLFARELASWLAVTRGESRGVLPATLHAVITSRLDLLSPAVRACARDAAVLGERFWTAAVAALGGIPVADAAAALAELARLELVHPVAETLPGTEGWAFRHALVRDAAYGQLTRADRAVRHAAAATWVQATGIDRPEMAALVADHRVLALELALAAGTEAPGIDVDGLRRATVDSLLHAGSLAAAFDQQVALGRFAQAVRVEAPPATRLAALEAFAGSACAAGDARRSLDAVADGLRVARDLGDAKAAGRLLGVRARARRIAGDDGWVRDVDEAIRVLEPLGDTRELLAAYGAETLVQLATGSADGILAGAGRAASLADRIGVELPDDVLERRGFARVMTGDAGGIDDIEHAIARARDGVDSRVLAEAIADLGNTLMYLGRVTEAHEAFRDGAELAASRGLATTAIETATNGASALRLLGRFDEFDAAIDDLETRAARIGYRRGDLIMAYERFCAAIARHDEAGARAALQRCETLATDHVLHAMLLGIARAIAAGRDGDARSFRDALGDWPLPEPDDLDNHDVAAFPAIARAALACGETASVERLAGVIGGAYPLGLAVRAELQGMLAIARGDAATGLSLLEDAAGRFASFGMAPEAAEVRAWIDAHRATPRAAG